MYLTDLAQAVRGSGLKVVEVPGWRSRGHGPMTDVKTIVCHHTAGAPTGNYPSLNVVRDGRAGLVGPLSHLGLGRDGTVYVIAAGLAYHAGATHERTQGNAYAIGIEAEHTGTGVWPAVQYDAYVRLCAALVEHYGLDVDRVQGHKEVASPAGRKVDPNFDMAAFRDEVAARNQEDEMSPEQEARIIAAVKESQRAVGLAIRDTRRQLGLKVNEVDDKLDALLDEG